MNTNFPMVWKKVLVVFLEFIENYFLCSFMNIFQFKFGVFTTGYPYYRVVVKLAIYKRRDKFKVYMSFKIQFIIDGYS